MTQNITDIPRRVLVVRFSALGDVAMTLPVIYSVALQYPQTTFIVVTRTRFSQLFINPPQNVEIYPVDLAHDYQGFRGLRRLIADLAALHPDAVADLHNMVRSWMIDNYFRLKNIPVAMVDKQRRRRKALMGGAAEEQPQYIDRYFEVFARLGMPARRQFTSLYPQGGWPEPPVDINHPAIGIAPFARYFNKTYPLELMEQAIALLVAKGYHIYLFGAPGQEAATLRRIADTYPGQCTNLAGQFDMAQELATMAQMDVMVCMDSANQHIAALAGCPTITIWGSTTPACGFMAYGADLQNSLVAGLDCQPCTVAGSPSCPKSTLACMMKIEPEMVVAKIERQFGKAHANV